jgi:hypothetical protein
MMLLNVTEHRVSEKTYNIKLENGKLIQYKEWHDGKGRLLETVIKDTKGKEIEDFTLLRKIWDLVEGKPNKVASLSETGCGVY